MDKARTWFACLGDANDPNAWSSIPHHVLLEGRRQGAMEAGVKLRIDARREQWCRRFWNLKHLLGGHRVGGYQYSPAFLERLWQPVMPSLRGANVINTFQLFPASMVADNAFRRWHYLDGTLRQLHGFYGTTIDRRWLADIHEREATGYRTARGVFAMSRFCADSLIKDYGVSPERVHVVIPGANLTHDVYQAFEPELERLYEGRRAAMSQGDRDEPIRLVFVGREAVRKGGVRLLRALAIGQRQGLRMTLRMIGLTAADVPVELRGIPGVEWVGLVSRRTDNERFCRLVAECDIGCLLSVAELAGISIREFMALGLPVIGPATGGSPDLMLPEACWSVAPEMSDEAIARLLLDIQSDRAGLARRSEAAWKARRSMLWEPAVRRIGEIIADDRVRSA